MGLHAPVLFGTCHHISQGGAAPEGRPVAIAAPTDTPPPPPANWDAFVQGLRDTGYMEGQNIAFEHRSAHDQPELFSKLALELASLSNMPRSLARDQLHCTDAA